MGISLIVDYYADKRPERADEFISCLRKNLSHPDVDEVWNLGFDDPTLPGDVRGHQKYRAENLGKRLTFSQALEFAGNRLSGRFVGVINLDIYLCEAYQNVTVRWAEAEALVRQTGIVLCQGRCELKPDGSITRDPHYSKLVFANTQDGWFFVSPLQVPDCDFELGTLGCDNAFAHRLLVAGIVPVNMGSRFPLIHVDICRGKHGANANAVHKKEHQSRQSTYSTFPEQRGQYLVPDIDLLPGLEALADQLGMNDLQKYRLKCDMMSRVIKIKN